MVARFYVADGVAFGRGKLLIFLDHQRERLEMALVERKRVTAVSVDGGADGFALDLRGHAGAFGKHDDFRLCVFEHGRERRRGDLHVQREGAVFFAALYVEIGEGMDAVRAARGVDGDGFSVHLHRIIRRNADAAVDGVIGKVARERTDIFRRGERFDAGVFRGIHLARRTAGLLAFPRRARRERCRGKADAHEYCWYSEFFHLISP